MARLRPSLNLNYSVKDGKIKNKVTPGVFFYWLSVTVPAGNNVFTVTQTITTGNFTRIFTLRTGGMCGTPAVTISNTMTQAANGTVTVSFNAPVAALTSSRSKTTRSALRVPRSRPRNNGSLRLRHDGRAWFDQWARSHQKLISSRDLIRAPC